MEIDFYKDNEQKAPTVEYYLFTDWFSEIMNGQYIEHLDSGKWYQVTFQTIADNKGDPHIVFLYPIERRPTVINLKTNNDEED